MATASISKEATYVIPRRAVEGRGDPILAALFTAAGAARACGRALVGLGARSLSAAWRGARAIPWRRLYAPALKGLGVAAAGALPGAAVAGAAYAASGTLYVAGGYAALVGAAAGFGAAQGVALLKLRHRALAAAGGVLAAALSLLAWSALEARGASGLSLPQAIAARAEQGIPVVRILGQTYTARGAVAYQLLGAELVAAALLSGLVAFRRSRAPFCEDCGAWNQRIRLYGPKEAAPMMAAALTFGDPKAIGALIEDTPEAEHARLEFYRCRRCAEASPLVVVSQVRYEKKRLEAREVGRARVPAWYGWEILRAIARPAGATPRASGLTAEPVISDRRPTLFDPRPPAALAEARPVA